MFVGGESDQAVIVLGGVRPRVLAGIDWTSNLKDVYSRVRD